MLDNINQQSCNQLSQMRLQWFLKHFLWKQTVWGLNVQKRVCEWSAHLSEYLINPLDKFMKTLKGENDFQQ